MKIQITQALPNGQVTQQVVVTKGGQPVKVQVQPNSKLSFDIESTGTKESDAAKVKATDIKRVGNSLILEAEGEALVEVVDFYSASGSSVGDITWNYVSPDFAAVTTTPEAQALAVAESSSLVAGVPIWLGVSSAAVVVAAAGGGGSGNSNAGGGNGADVTPPTITISDNVAATTTATPVLYTFTFSEAVTGFDASKLTVTGGTAGTFTKINDSTYTLVVTPTAASTGNIVVTATTTGVSDLAANAMVQTTGLSSTQAYDTTTPVVDSAAPTVVISDGVSATTATGPVQYTFTFSEAVSGFTASNITVTGGVAGTLMAVNDHTFTLVVTPTAATASNIVVSMLTTGVSDLAGNAMVQTTGLSSTQAYDTTTPVVDTTAPTLVITDDESAATANGPVQYTFTFSEAVTGFDASKVSVTGGTAGTFTKINDSTYTLVVTPTANATGNIVVTAATTGVSDLAANAMVQTTGLTSTQAYDTTTPVVDTTAPTVVISDSVAAATANGPVQYTFTFSEAVSGFDIGKINVTGGTAGTFTVVNDHTFTLVVTPTAATASNIVVSMLTTGVSDLAGNAMVQTTGLSSTQAYDTTTPVVDTTAPTLVITDDESAATANGPVQYTFTFSEAVTGFDASKVSVTGGTAGTFTKINDSTYTLVVTPTANATGNIVVTAATTGVSDLAANAMVQTTGLTSTQAYDTTTPVVDTTAPTVVISDSVAAATANGPVQYTFTFSEAVSGFDIGKINVTGGTAGTFTVVNDHTFTLVVTPTAATASNIVVSMLTTGVSDLAGNAMVQTTGLSSTQAYDTTTPVVDTTAPTLVITDDESAATANGPVQYTFTFSEAVTGFDASKVSVTGGTAGTFTKINDSTYTLVVTPTANATGNIVVTAATTGVSDLAANAMVQTTGLTSTQAYDTTTPVVDTTAPTVVISDSVAAATANGPVQYTFTFSEAVSGFDIGKINVTGGTAGTFTVVNDHTFTLVVTPTAATASNIVVSMLTTGVSDLAGNAMVQTTGLSSTQAYDTTTPVVDTTAPTLVITDDESAATANGPVQYTFTFSEAVTGFDASKVSVTGGTAGTFTKINDSTYTLVVTPTANATGNIVVTAATTGVSDLAANAMVQTTGLTSTQAYDTTTPVVDTTAPTVVISDSVAAATANGPVQYTFTFSEAVSGFDIGKINVTGGTAGTFTVVNDHTFTLVVTPTAATASNIVVSMLTTGVSDLAGNAMVQTTGLSSTQAYDTTTPVVDTTAPTLVITDDESAATANGPVQYTFTFSEAVTGFDASKVSVTGGTAGTFTKINDSTYTLVVTPTANATGNIVVTAATTGVSDLSANAMVQTTGLSSTQAYDTQNTTLDTTAPTVVITDNIAVVTASGPVQYTFTFSEAVSNFDISKINVTGGTAGILTAVNDRTFTLVVTPTANATGNIVVSMLTTGVSDLAGNAMVQTTGLTSTQAYDTTAAVADTTPPTLTITDNAAAATVTGPVQYTFTFSEAVSDFDVSKITVAGGTIGELTLVSSSVYQLVVTPTNNATGNITVSVAAATVHDLANNALAATTSATVHAYDTTSTLWSVAALADSVNEDAGTISYVITRTGNGAAATIDFSTGGGTATAGSDYTAVSQTVSFAAGELSKTIQVALTNDTVAESNETVLASLSNASVGSMATSTATATILDNDQSIWSVGVSPTSVDESAGFITYTVSRTGATGASTIDFSTGGGTAIAGSDYTAVSQTLTFAAGEMSKTVQVAVTDDTESEAQESLAAAISNASQGSIATNTVTATILDNDHSVWSIATGTPSVDEGTGFITYTVSRTGVSTAATVNFVTGGGTATAGSDYTAVSQTLTFAAGEMSKTVQVAVTNDSVAESDETVVATISNVSQGSVDATFATAAATSTILDNDQSIWSVATTTSSVDEGAGLITYTVNRTGASNAATLDFATGGGTATAGSDYTAVSQTLTFAAGEMTKTVQVAITDDAVVEANETVFASISNVSAGSISTGTTSATITDNDQALWSVAANTATVDEGTGQIFFTVSRTGTTSAATIHFSTGSAGGGNSATPGLDYTAVDQTLSFAAGEMSKTIAVTLTDDVLPEPNENVFGIIDNASIGAIVTGSASTTITDNEQANWVVTANTARVDEGSGYISYSVTRSGLTSTAATIDFATAGGTATAGSDYTALSQTLSFAAGETSKTVLVAITDDTAIEGDETVTAVITGSSQGDITTASAAATLTDNELTVWSVSSPNTTVNEGAGYALYTVSRTGPLTAGTIDFAAKGVVNTLVQPAEEGADFTTTALTLSFAAGEASKTVRVPLIDDNVPEVNKAVAGQIGNASVGVLGTSSTVVNIQDDDQSIWQVTNIGNVAEGAGTVAFTIARYGASGSATMDLVLLGTATNGVDYTASASQALTFAAGEMTKTVLVNLTNDTTPELNETIFGTLTNVSQGSVLDAVRGVTIVDDDSMAWAVTQTGASEGGTLVYTVTRTGDTSTAASIDFATSGGTAAAGVDFTSLNQTLSFAAGETRKTVLVATTSDTVAEANETVIGTITSATAGTITTGAASATISDDDQSVWSVAAAVPTVQESNGYAFFTITRTGSLGAATIDFNTLGNANAGVQSLAAAGLDYVPMSQTLSFAEGETTKTVQVTLLDDNLLEWGEAFSGVISNASSGSVATSIANASISDNDTNPTFVVTAESSSVEGGLLLLRVSRAASTADQAATVDLISTGTGTATPGVDYVFASQTLSFAPGEMMKMIAVSSLDDSLAENTETITFGLVNPSAGAATASPAVSVSIVDNDGLVSWSIAAASTTVDEGAGYATFTVSRDAANTAATIDVATMGGTAWAGASNDYDTLAQSLSFAVGEFSKTVRIALHEDTLLEGNETVLVGLSNASAGHMATASVTQTIADNDLSIWSVAASGASTFEATGASLIFIVSRTGDLSAATIDIASITGGRSIAGIDYTPVRQTLTFGVGESSKLVGIPIIDDSKPDTGSLETVNMYIGNQSSGRIATASAVLGINSSDETRTLFAVAGATSVDDMTAATFTLTRTGDISGTDTISYSVSGAGGATAGTDFVATSGTATFLPGVRLIYIGVPLIADTGVDTGKSLVMTLQNASSGTIATASATSSLTDNDAAATGANTYAVAATSNNVYESAGTAEFTITRSGDLTIASTSYFRANSGTATSGTDYTAITSTTLNWAAGETVKVVSVTLLDDALAEASKTITGQSATDSGFTTSVTSGNLTLLDDDTPGSGTNAYTITGTNGVIESNGTMAFTITRSGDLTIGSTSYFRTNGGTAATDGSDYTVINSQTLNWSASETTKVVFVTLTNDNVSEANETVIGQVATDTGFTTGLVTSSGANITDDDLWTATAGVADTFTYGTASGGYTGTMMVDSGDMADSVSISSTFGAGVGVINLDSGTDRLNVNSPTNFLSLLRVDGGSDVDTLAYSGTSAFNHYAQGVDSFVTGFEILDLATAITNQTVGLSLADVLEITRGNAVADTLRIMGNAVSGDVLNLQVAGKTLATPAAGSSITDVDGTVYTVSASAAGNASANDVTFGGNTYDVYQYAFDSHTVNLLIHTTITTNVI